MQMKSILATVATAAVLGTFVAWPALASAEDGKHGLGYGYGYGYGYGTNERPGWGFGDKNHDHTGPPGLDEDFTPPGLIGKDSQHQDLEVEDEDDGHDEHGGQGNQGKNESDEGTPQQVVHSPDDDSDHGNRSGSSAVHQDDSDDDSGDEDKPGNGRSKSKSGKLPPGLAKKQR